MVVNHQSNSNHRDKQFYHLPQCARLQSHDLVLCFVLPSMHRACSSVLSVILRMLYSTNRILHEPTTANDNQHYIHSCTNYLEKQTWLSIITIKTWQPFKNAWLITLKQPIETKRESINLIIIIAFRETFSFTHEVTNPCTTKQNNFAL